MSLQPLACWDCGFEYPRGTSMSVSVSFVCVAKYRCPWRADHSSRGVLLSVVCLSMIEEPHRAGLGRKGAAEPRKRK